MSIKGIIGLLLIAGLLSFFTGGLTLLIFAIGVVYYIFGSYFTKAIVKFPVLLLKLLLLPFVALLGVSESIGNTGKFLWHSGMRNIKKEKTRYADEEEDDEDEDKGVIGYSIEGVKGIFSIFTRYKLRYVLVLLFWIYALGYPSIFSTVISSPERIIELDNIGMLLLLGFPFILTVLVSSFSYQFIGGNRKFWEAASEPIKDRAPSVGAAGAAGAAGSMPSAADAAKKTKEGVDTFKDIRSGVNTVAEPAEGFLAESLEGTAAESLAGGSIAGLGPVAIVLLAILMVLMYAGVIAIVGSIVGAMTWGWFNVMLPFFAKPILGALGLGGAYAQWFGQSTGNTIGPQLDDTFQEEIRMAEQMAAKFGCMLKGPQCLREWRMNNTVRPGSEEVGETYELRIDQFGLINDRVDVAYKEKYYKLPVNFLVSNTRHGLKGITARDVRYKISVEDLNNQGSNAYCTTGWKRIDTGTGDFILPGLGVSPTKTLSSLNLGNCGMLQPSLGINRVLTMEVKYNYSSQATLYFDAMSRQYRREKGIEPSFKKSQTAKTPVQSYINIQSPVTYFTSENSVPPRQPVPFSARFGFETPGFDVRYKVHPDSVKIYDSSLTNVTEVADCTGLNGSAYGTWNDNTYGMSNRAEQRIRDRQQNSWFDRNLNPAPLRCTMQISEKAVTSISPTGEQLIMRIDGNYTVVKEDENRAFEVVNTRCTRLNCPLIVTDEYNASHEAELYDTCDYGSSVDSYDGCTVIIPSEPPGYNDDTRSGYTQEGDIDWTDPQIATTQSGSEMILERGETAYRADTVVGWIQSIQASNDGDVSRDYIVHRDVQSLSGVVGMTEEEKSQIMSSSGATNFVIYREDRNEGRSVKLTYEHMRTDVEPCQEYSDDREAIKNELEDRELPEGAELMAYGMRTRDCTDNVQETLDTLDCGVDLVSELPQQLTGWNTFIEGGGLFGEATNSCQRIVSKLNTQAQNCNGAVVYSPSTASYRCWGGQSN